MEVYESKRQPVYDYIRVFSCILVIGIHSTRVFADFSTIQMKAAYVLHAFCRMGLPMFYILSGALLLSSKKKETVRQFYSNKFIKIFIPFLIYSVFYVVWVNNDVGITDITRPDVWKMMIKGIPGAIIDTLQTYQSTHLWFMYSIVGIYLVIPFLKVMMQNADEKLQKDLCCLLLIMSMILYYFPHIFGFGIGITDYIWGGWIMYILIGYTLVQPWMEKYYKIIKYAGLISFFVSVIVYMFFSQYATERIYDLAPSMMLQACSAFIFMYEKKEKLSNFKRLNSIVFLFSKYTFSIYMLHGFILTKLAEFEVLSGLLNLYLLRSIIIILMTFLLSFCIAVVIDNTIIKGVKYILGKVF